MPDAIRWFKCKLKPPKKLAHLQILNTCIQMLTLLTNKMPEWKALVKDIQQSIIAITEVIPKNY